jgi:lysophospholipase L1-like esterase
VPGSSAALWPAAVNLGAAFLALAFLIIAPASANPEPNAAAASDHSAAAIRILPLGDSITQGGRRDRPEYTYRYPLYFLLSKAGYRVDFIGSMKTGLDADAVWPDRGGIAFDPDHEGHYGWTTAQVAEKLPGWIAKYPAPPDVALVHLGSNDYGHINYYASIIRPLGKIIATLRGANPRIVILVSLLNENGRRPWIVRRMLQGMAWWANSETSALVIVDHHTGWREDPTDPLSDTFDGAHPNPRGQEKMAAAWFAKLAPYLDRINSERQHRSQ